MKCPFCNGIIGPQSYENSFIICCEHCNYIYSLKGPGHLIAKTIDDKQEPLIFIGAPVFKINSQVICIDQRHQMFLEYGKVIGDDVLHTRVDFSGLKIWIDKNLIQEIPTEWTI